MSTTDSQTPARQRFLRLRDAVGLPDGGEVVHKGEIEEVARHLGIGVGEKTKPRLVFECVRRAKKYRYGYFSRTWDEAKQSARDYTYLQSSEAEMIAELAEDINHFEWG